MKFLIKDNRDSKYVVELNEKTSNNLIFSVGNIKKCGKVLGEIKDETNTTADFIRFATAEDNEFEKEIKEIEKHAMEEATKIAKKYNLEMTVINSTYDFDGSQLLIEFYSENRVDFRSLAKDLAGIFKTRIELKQIGIRDKAKLVGGYGPCGQQLCCKRCLKQFDSVSINMAKNQNISLNPSKINGVCGRLLCCLKYENEEYSNCKKCLPKKGSMVETKKGKGKVIDINVLEKKYKVNIENVGVIEFTCGEN